MVQIFKRCQREKDKEYGKLFCDSSIEPLSNNGYRIIIL